MLRNFILQLLNVFYPLVRKFMPFQVYAYLALGAVNTLLNIGLFLLCFQALVATALALETATVVSFAVTVFSGFWLHKNFAFTDAGNDKKEIQQQFGKYALVSLQGQVSAYLLTKGMVVLLQLNASVAYVLTAVVMLTLNYFLQKYFTFRKKKIKINQVCTAAYSSGP
jgi:putative flippase GtrA